MSSRGGQMFLCARWDFFTCARGGCNFFQVAHQIFLTPPPPNPLPVLNGRSLKDKAIQNNIWKVPSWFTLHSKLQGQLYTLQQLFNN